MRTRNDIGKILQVLSFFVVVMFAMRGHPPARAQALSGMDMVQNHDILENKSAVDSLTLQVSKQNDAINNAINTISGIQGEERGLAGVLILLQIGQFVFKVKQNGAKV